MKSTPCQVTQPVDEGPLTKVGSFHINVKQPRRDVQSCSARAWVNVGDTKLSLYTVRNFMERIAQFSRLNRQLEVGLRVVVQQTTEELQSKSKSLFVVEHWYL